MGDRVHFSVNGIFTGFETPLSHIFFFFCLKDSTSSAILTEMYFARVCVCMCVCLKARA